MKNIIKKTKKFFKNLLKQKGKLLSQKEAREYKRKIRLFFEGWDGTGDMAVIPIVISQLQITDIKFIEFKNSIEAQITLGRPGLLIGKGGSTVYKLTEFLSFKKPVTISISESKLWI